MIKVWDYLREYELLRDDILNAVDDVEVVIDCEDEEYKVPFRLIERAHLVPQF